MPAPLESTGDAGSPALLRDLLPAEEVHDDHDQGDQEKQMDEPTRDMNEKADCPEDDQEESD
jgi:hypothetical protein